MSYEKEVKKDFEENINLEEIMRKIKELRKDNGFIKYMGIEYLECGPGTAKGRLRLDENIKNPFGGVHGGCIFSLADTIGGTAAMTRGNYVTTLSGSVEYLRPPKDTEFIYAEAEEIKNGRTISVYDVYITNDDGKKLAKVTLSFFKLETIQ